MKTLFAALMTTVLVVPSTWCAAADPPVVVVKVASLDQVQDGLSFIGSLTKDALFPDKFARFAFEQMWRVKNLTMSTLAAAERQKPLGAVVTPVGVMVSFVGVSDPTKFIESLSTQVGKPEELDGGVFRFGTDPNYMFVKGEGAWVYFAEMAEHLEALPDAEAALASVQSESLLAISIAPQGMTSVAREQLLTQFGGVLGAGGATGEAAAPADPAAALAKVMGDAQRTGLEQLFAGAEQITLNLSIDKQAKKLKTDALVKPLGGSALAARVEGLSRGPSRFGGLATEDAFTAMHLNIPLDAEQVEQYKAQVEAYRAAVVDVLDRAPELSTDASRENVKKLAMALMDVTARTVESGRLNFAVRITGKPFPITMVAGLQTTGGGALNERFEELAEMAKSDPGFGTIGLDVAKHLDARIHTFSLASFDKATDPLSKALKMMFAEPLVHVAVAEEHVWFAMGKDALESLKSAMDSSEGEAAPVQLTSHFSKWPGVLGIMVPEPAMQMGMAMIGANLGQGNDVLTATVEKTDMGLQMTSTVGDGFMRVMAVILPFLSQMGGQGGQGGGRPGFGF